MALGDHEEDSLEGDGLEALEEALELLSEQEATALFEALEEVVGAGPDQVESDRVESTEERSYSRSTRALLAPARPADPPPSSSPRVGSDPTLSLELRANWHRAVHHLEGRRAGSAGELPARGAPR